jgi:hypothetical protein
MCSFRRFQFFVCSYCASGIMIRITLVSDIISAFLRNLLAWCVIFWNINRTAVPYGISRHIQPMLQVTFPLGYIHILFASGVNISNDSHHPPTSTISCRLFSKQTPPSKSSDLLFTFAATSQHAWLQADFCLRFIWLCMTHGWCLIRSVPKCSPLICTDVIFWCLVVLSSGDACLY